MVGILYKYNINIITRYLNSKHQIYVEAVMTEQLVEAAG